jgi:hypothetical protein
MKCGSTSGDRDGCSVSPASRFWGVSSGPDLLYIQDGEKLERC